MKKIVILLFLGIQIFLIPAVNGQDYFPLAKGNRFLFNYSWSAYWTGGGHSSGSRRLVMAVTDTITYNSKKYYYCSGIPYLVQGWVRVDSITKSLYRYTGNNNCPYYNLETLVDSLGIIAAGTENGCRGLNFGAPTNDTLFGFPSSKLYFWTSIFPDANILSSYTGLFYNKKFGIKSYSSSYSGGLSSSSDDYVLLGCRIDGVSYGDTMGISTDIQSFNGIEIPGFRLAQNYPNPFNPLTMIKFDVPYGNVVVLKVYDLLGRELSVLVNERLQPGTYETTFDGSGLNSGVYFYRLTAGEYTETRKMILIK